MAKKPLYDRQHRNNDAHAQAREDYLFKRGPEARRRRSAERGGTVRIDPGSVIQPSGLAKWEEDLLALSEMR